jgi:hypothetical protein
MLYYIGVGIFRANAKSFATLLHVCMMHLFAALSPTPEFASLWRCATYTFTAT